MNNMLYRMFRPKSPQRFGSLCADADQNKPVGGAEVMPQASKRRTSVADHSPLLSSPRPQVSIRLLQRTPCPSHFHSRSFRLSGSLFVGRQLSECYVQRMASRSISTAVHWLPDFFRCMRRVQHGLSSFRLYDFDEPSNNRPRLLR